MILIACIWEGEFMACQNPYRGQIKTICQKSKKEIKNIRFDITPPNRPPVTQTLMINFKRFNLSEREKKQLSHKHREQIVAFQTVNDELMNKYTERLIKLIKHKDVQSAHIEASDFGAFICLAALYSGNFPKDTPVTFQLTSLPLSLFPEKWVYDVELGPDVDIHFSSDVSWQGQFQSFVEPPEHLKFPEHIQRSLKSKIAA